MNQKCLYSAFQSGTSNKQTYLGTKLLDLLRLTDAAHKCFESVKDVLINLVVINLNKLNSALFIQRYNGILLGRFVGNVVNYLHAGNKLFHNDILILLIKKITADKFKKSFLSYVGFQIMQNNLGIILGQPQYLKDISEIYIN